MRSQKSLLFWFVVIALLLVSHDAVSDAYERVLHENHGSLKSWSIPIARLSILDAKPDPNEEHVLDLQVDVIEVLRNGSINLQAKRFNAQWRTYRARAAIYKGATYEAFQSEAEKEPTGDDLIKALRESNLLCFTGHSFPRITLYAYNCFIDNAHNRMIANDYSQKRPLSSYVYEFSQSFTLIFPLLGFIVVFFAPRTGIAIAAMTYPSFIYYNSKVPATTIRYDYLVAYPAMLFAAFVIAFGLARWLHQMVKEEQAAKAQARESETPKPD